MPSVWSWSPPPDREPLEAGAVSPTTPASSRPVTSAAGRVLRERCVDQIEPWGVSGPASLGSNGLASEVPGRHQDHSLELVHLSTYPVAVFVCFPIMALY